MSFEQKAVSAEEFDTLVAGREIPATAVEAQAKGYVPYKPVPDALRQFRPETVFVRPGFARVGGAACGVMFDRNGNVVPTYYDPGTGTCTIALTPPAGGRNH